ncbi:hypothetical protein AB0C60_12575, partial [Streptomyces sp. NPDC048845]
MAAKLKVAARDDRGNAAAARGGSLGQCGMTTQRPPFPVPDERAHLFVDSYADMHDLVEDLVVADGVPGAAATVLCTARELLRQSYYCYELDHPRSRDLQHAEQQRR